MTPGLDHKASLSRLLLDADARYHDLSMRPLRILYSKDHRVGRAMASYRTASRHPMSPTHRSSKTVRFDYETQPQASCPSILCYAS